MPIVGYVVNNSYVVFFLEFIINKTLNYWGFACTWIA